MLPPVLLVHERCLLRIDTVVLGDSRTMVASSNVCNILVLIISPPVNTNPPRCIGGFSNIIGTPVNLLEIGGQIWDTGIRSDAPRRSFPPLETREQAFSLAVLINESYHPKNKNKKSHVARISLRN